MKKILNVLAPFVLFLLITCQANGQYSENGWILGGGFNFIDDSGTYGSQPFNFTDNWNSVAFPSRFSMGYLLTNGMFFQGFASYNRYNQDVIVDGIPQSTQWNYYALDGLVGYGFKELIDPRGWFDPYVQTGMGLNRLAGNNELTFNLGGGFHFWINERFAINLSTLGKWELDNSKRDNHIQHGLGVTFKPDFKRLFAGKGGDLKSSKGDVVSSESIPDDELLASTAPVATAPVPDVAAIEQRIKDSIAAAMATKRSIEQKAEIITQKLKNDLVNISRVTFATNSSYLKESDYTKLDELLAFMNYYPTAVIEIRGNVDARGTEEYNAWLSVRRSGRIKAYLTKKGIHPDRIQAVGSIKNKMEAPCKEDNPCTEEELTESRKVEYVLLDY